MIVLSQRDPRWAGTQLGFGSNTIGSHGCTITCIAMLADLTPDEVNERLKKVQGYQVDLVIWSKIKEAIPWLEFEWRGYEYDNSKVVDAIGKYNGCLVEVDFDNRITTPNDHHWVLYTGSQQLADPWTGVVKSTSYYSNPTGFSVIKVLPKTEVVVVAPPIDDKTKISLGEPWGDMEVQAIRSTINDQKRTIESLEQKSKQLDGFIAKWVEEWKLPVSSNLVEIENEMSKLMLLEDKVQEYRDAIEKAVGAYPDDSSLLEALHAVWGQITKMSDEIASLQQKLLETKVPAGYKFLKSWNIGKLLFKLYRR